VRKLVILGVAVLVLGFAADIGAKALAVSQIESAARRQAPEASANAAIPVFPFLPPLLLAGKVNEVSVHMVHVAAGPIFFDSLDFDMHGVQLSRKALLQQRRIELVKIDRGTVTALAALPAAAAALPSGAVTARVSGRSILLRGPGGLSASIPLPATSLIPCAGTAAVEAGRVKLTCTLTDIPPALVRAASRAGAGP
jgi:hypothetical protein